MIPKPGSSYPGKMSVYDFGRELIQTNDLDPVYVLLHKSGFDCHAMEKFLLAYWCFYNVGTASWIADPDTGFWERMQQAAGSKDYPRCHERRHFRGENACKSVAYLRNRGLSDLFADWKPGVSRELEQVMDWVQEWVGFGPWIAFKVADMLERLGMVPVQFDDGAMFLFDSPREGAKLMWRLHGDKGVTDVQTWAVDKIIGVLRKFKAPPRYERTINCQEAETILCKWKSYMGGHYTLGEDITACKKGLMKFNKVSMAQRLLKAGKDGKLW